MISTNREVGLERRIKLIRNEDEERFKYWGKRFWEEADKEESFDIGEIAMYYVPMLERKVVELLDQLRQKS